ncbi:hypothetical protein [Dyella caseinilytica]|uniref:Uncharacterized protein n=1 Tax=Dyella caseinilytica TaxID=1849581 RepID=A0ABX7GSI1_9GAMM|nr:hypothetical protein [Dyella caseinilytica]QRN52981.1 hypothetical protein ISN74_16280 [Dyella caseinilytica]GGA10487.1 hypothetical protein GCM10011408_34770 [Dyella caseinilytica]
MTISSISSTQSPSVSGLVATQHTHHKSALDASSATAVATPAGSSTANSQLASAIAAALTQLGLVSTPRTASIANDSATAAAGTYNAAVTSSAPLAPLPQQLKGSQQIQQYTNIASTFSSLAQALGSVSSSTPSTSGDSGSLATVFQNLWASLGSSSGTSTDVSRDAIPSLPTFLQTLARNLSESGVSGLRGVFVDTMA